MAVQSYEDRQLALLRPNYPRWDIWFVRSAVGRYVTWHARPAGSPVATVHADTPERLIELIGELETGDGRS